MKNRNWRYGLLVTILGFVLSSCGGVSSLPSNSPVEGSTPPLSSGPQTFTFFINSYGGGTIDGTANGTYSLNTPIHLEAIANNGYSFVGYYENQTLLSSEAEYNFLLNRSYSLSARFQLEDIEGYYEVNYAHVFKQGDFGLAGGETALINGLKWTYSPFTMLGGASQGVQIGSKNNPQKTEWVLNTALPEGIIVTSYYVELCTATNANAKYTVNFGEYTREQSFNHTDLTKYFDSGLSVASTFFTLKLISSSKAMYFYALGFSLLVPEDIDLPLSGDKIEGVAVVPGTNGIPSTSYALITPEQYYQTVDFSSSKDTLFASLRTLISTMTRRTYSDAKTMLQYTDENPFKRGFMYGLYDGDDVYATWDNGASWNREHVWACAQMRLGGVDPRPSESTKNHGTDLHNLRVACQLANGKHGNKFYDESDSEKTLFPNVSAGFSGYHNYVGDFRGDVARILFYMYVRYEGLELDDNLDTANDVSMGKLSTLLLWNQIDPVDDFETQRNNRIYEYQGNRNPFIDHPEIAQTLLG